MSDQKTVTLTCDCGVEMTAVIAAKKLSFGNQGFIGFKDSGNPVAIGTSHTCKPPLPTEPGIYRDKDGELWALDFGGNWLSTLGASNSRRNTENRVAEWGPFTRVRTLADDEVAVKIDVEDRVHISSWLGLIHFSSPSGRYMTRIAEAAKEAGLLDGGDHA